MARTMRDRLEEERKKRMLETIPETVRMILSEYLSTHPLLVETEPAESWLDIISVTFSPLRSFYSGHQRPILKAFPIFPS